MTRSRNATRQTGVPVPGVGTAPWGARAAGRAGLLSGIGCAVIGVAAAGVGLALSGVGAAFGALIGAGLAGGVFVLGALAVQVVSRVYPPASLLVALLTYVCQVLAALMVFAILTRGALIHNGTVSAPWVGATLSLCAVLWVTVHVRVAATARVPLYDLPEAGAR